MRQVLDMLVWLGMISVVAAVIYFTPRFAHSLALMGSRDTEGYKAEIAALHPDTADVTR
jgi:hypothetical protein